MLQSIVSKNIGLGINVFKYTTTTGINNIGIGGNVFSSNTTGKNNIGIGGNVFVANTSGQNNTSIGNDSGINVLGSNNTMLGSNTGQSDNNIYNNSTAIGYGAIVSSSNQIVIGTTNESLIIPSTALSTNATTGALTVLGGIGVGGNVYLTGNLIVNANIYINGQLIGTVPTTGTISTDLGTNPLTAGNIVASCISINSNIASLNTTSGALIVAGGVGISGLIYVGGNIALYNNNFTTTLSLNASNDLSITGNSVIIKSNIASSNNSNSGALTVTGGVGITGNSYIGGNLMVTGNVFINGVLVTGNTAIGTGSLIVNSISTGTITCGVITSTSHNMGTNPLSAGNITVGTIISSAIGVGLSNPSAPLQILPTNNNVPHYNGLYVYNTNTGLTNHAIASMRTMASSGNPYISWDIVGVNGWSMGIDNSDSQKFKISNAWSEVNANTKVTIATNGNVGIGTTTPAYKLDINGTINATAYYLNGTAIVSLDGSTSARAAPSAKYIQQSFGIYTNGIYWINLPTVGAVQIFCIMDAAYAGGGWMLALKATRANTFPYLSTYWTDKTTTLNTGDFTRNDSDAKFHTFNYFLATDWMALWPDAGFNGGDIPLTSGGWSWVELNAVGSTISCADFFAGNTTVTKLSNGVGYTATNPIPINSQKFSSSIWSSQSGFQFYGINYKSSITPTSNNVRWGWGWNDQADQLSNDYRGGIGLSALSAYSAGDNGGSGLNRSMRVEWYVR